MANELQIALGLVGRQIYSVIRNQTSGFVWSLSGGTSGAFGLFASGSWAEYAVSMVEQGVNGYYLGNMPSAIPAGVYAVTAYQQQGASPVQLDGRVGQGDVQWNGSTVVADADGASSGQLAQFLPVRMARGTMVQNFPFKMVSSADHASAFTSGVVSGQISRDGGIFTALQSGTISETGLGWYRVTLTSGDLNANTAALTFTGVQISGGAADPRDFAIVLQKWSG